MAVRWSRIQAELGIAPAELTSDMIVRAVELGVEETEDLDWKQALPVDVDKKLKEVAKDVAAMANTRGGLIVYGVREEKQRAVEITPVSTAERERERLRALATRVRPLIAGIEILPLTAGDGVDDGIIVVSVPASPDAPHVVGERNEMGVPFRHGPHTEWMSEHQLERAYRDRFTRQANEAETMTSLLDDIKVQLDFNKGVWLVVAGRPLSPSPAVMSRPEPSHVNEVMTDALRVGAQIYPSSPERVDVLRQLDTSATRNPRIGLRRWVTRSNSFESPNMLTNFIHIELHHDGTSVIAVAIAKWATRGTYDDVHPVPTRVAQSALAEAVAVVTSHARRRGYAGPMLIRSSLLKPNDSFAFAAVDNHVGGGMYINTMEVVRFSRAPQQIIPVAIELSADAEPEVLRSAVRQLSEDLLHQFGIQDLIIPE